MELQNTGGRMQIINCMSDTYLEDLRRDALEGLTADKKSIPCKYFYDERGSRLFEDICHLPEYYQTRTELSILNGAAPGIMEEFSGGDLVELGSGANWKIRRLLDQVEPPRLERTCYMPVDVSESALVEAAEELLRIYRNLRVVGVIADFATQIDEIPAGRSKVFVFFGSTIGNFTEEESDAFLKDVSRNMQAGDRFVLGIDMVKEPDILEKAYNDSQGVTAEFNRNVLHVLNNNLGAEFDAESFDHVAFFNEEKKQVEMHLRARRRLTVGIRDLDLVVTMQKGETIHTEICRKFTRESAEAMAAEAGLCISQWFSDEKEWFSVLELAAADPAP